MTDRTQCKISNVSDLSDDLHQILHFRLKQISSSCYVHRGRNKTDPVTSHCLSLCGMWDRLSFLEKTRNFSVWKIKNLLEKTFCNKLQKFLREKEIWEISEFQKWKIFHLRFHWSFLLHICNFSKNFHVFFYKIFDCQNFCFFSK